MTTSRSDAPLDYLPQGYDAFAFDRNILQRPDGVTVDWTNPDHVRAFAGALSHPNVGLPADPALPLDELAVRQIVADVDRVTTGRRRVDIAHALLRIVAHEVASNADTPAAAKHRGQLVAKDLKAAVRERYTVRQRQAGTL